MNLIHSIEAFGSIKKQRFATNTLLVYILVDMGGYVSVKMAEHGNGDIWDVA